MRQRTPLVAGYPQRRLSAAERRAAMPPQLRVLTDVAGAIGLGFAAGFIAHGPATMAWPATFGVAATAAAVFVLWRVIPHIVATGVVLAGWLVMTPLITWLFAAVTPEFGLDFQGRLAGLALYALLVAVLAHKTSRGRPWLTTALALAAVTTVAAAGYRFTWHSGVWVAYGAGLLVVVLRAGTVIWVRDLIDQMANWRTARADRRVEMTRWLDVHSAELATASTLSRLPGPAQVLHDRIIPGSVDDAYTVDHVVITAAGVNVVASMQLKNGSVTHRRDGSVWHRDRTLDKPLREAWWQARVVEQLSGLPTRAVLAIQGPATLVAPMKIGLYEHQGDQDEALQGDVILVHGGDVDGRQLLDALTAGAAGYTPAQVKRYTRRIGKVLPAGQLTEPSSWSQRTQIAALWPDQALPYVVAAAVPADDPNDESTPPPTSAATPKVADVAVQTPAELSAEISTTPAPRPVELPEHREYQWDGGEEADAIAQQGMEKLASCTLRPGDKVNALRPDGMLVGWVVLAEPYIHADGMPVVDIVDPAEWAAAQKKRMTPEQYLAEPLQHLMAVDA